MRHDRHASYSTVYRGYIKVLKKALVLEIDQIRGNLCREILSK